MRTDGSFRMLNICDLTKSYASDKPPAVDALDMQVKDGEIFGFLGPNGAGKTTTIKMITGIIAPDRGSVEIDGVDMRKDPVACKMKFGYVPDNPDIYERLTGMEYLEFLGDVYMVTADERKKRIRQYTEMFGISSVLGDQIKSYSHGMRQKLVITGALLHNPRLWILDEPMVGLDPMAAHLLKEEMRAHCRQGNTVFFSTHVLEVAEKLCDRVGIISRGKLAAVGTVADLKAQAEQKGSSLEDIFLRIVT